MIIGQEQVESAQDLLFEVVPVPEWGGDARMQEFSTDGRAIFGAWSVSVYKDGSQDARSVIGYAARVVALSLSNEDGTLVYPDFEKGVAILLKKKSKTLGRLADVTYKLSGLGDAVGKVAEELPNTESGSAS